MTVLVMPDVIGHLVVRQGRLPVGPAMTVFVMPDVIGHLVVRQGRLPVGAGNDGLRHARRDRASRAAGRGDCRSGPAMTVFVMPDVIGHLVLPAGGIAGRGRQ